MPGQQGYKERANEDNFCLSYRKWLKNTSLGRIRVVPEDMNENSFTALRRSREIAWRKHYTREPTERRKAVQWHGIRVWEFYQRTCQSNESPNCARVRGKTRRQDHHSRVGGGMGCHGPSRFLAGKDRNTLYGRKRGRPCNTPT